MIPTGDPASTYASVEVTLREPSTSWPEVQARARPPGYEGPFGWPLPGRRRHHPAHHLGTAGGDVNSRADLDRH